MYIYYIKYWIYLFYERYVISVYILRLKIAVHPTVSITKPSPNMLCFVFVHTIEHAQRFCTIFPTKNKTPLCTCTVLNELIVGVILIAAESMQVPLGKPLLRHQMWTSMWTISWHEVTVISNPNDSFLKDLLFIMAHLSSGSHLLHQRFPNQKRNSFQTNNFTGHTGNSCNITVHS